MSSTRAQRINRRTAAFALLLWLCLPAGLVAWIVTGDWRWMASGTVAHLTGWAVAGILTAGQKAGQR